MCKRERPSRSPLPRRARRAEAAACGTRTRAWRAGRPRASRRAGRNTRTCRRGPRRATTGRSRCRGHSAERCAASLHATPAGRSGRHADSDGPRARDSRLRGTRRDRPDRQASRCVRLPKLDRRLREQPHERAPILDDHGGDRRFARQGGRRAVPELKSDGAAAQRAAEPGETPLVERTWRRRLGTRLNSRL